MFTWLVFFLLLNTWLVLHTWYTLIIIIIIINSQWIFNEWFSDFFSDHPVCVWVLLVRCLPFFSVLYWSTYGPIWIESERYDLVESEKEKRKVNLFKLNSIQLNLIEIMKWCVLCVCVWKKSQILIKNN